jgi:hypothetical protein
MKIDNLLAYTPEPDRSNSKKVKILRVYKSLAKKKEMLSVMYPDYYVMLNRRDPGLRQTLLFVTKTEDAKGPLSNRMHIQAIFKPELRRPYYLSDVQVSCTCERFKYTWEWALHQKRASLIHWSNGEPPHEKNPNNIPGVCKHLYKGMLYMRKLDL